MITVAQMSKVFRTKSVETTALNNINFQIEEGEFISIMGPSGCGKSTLLNILGLLTNPSDGQYTLFGEDVSRYREYQRSRLRKANIGFIFQNFNLIHDLTVFENVELSLKYLKVAVNKRRQRVEQVLEHMDLLSRKDHYPAQLSGGQQQRVAIARAVVIRPRLILADEPTGNLDSVRGTEVMNLLQELHHDGTTLVMVTHSTDCTTFSDRTLHMLDGHLMGREEAVS